MAPMGRAECCCPTAMRKLRLSDLVSAAFDYDQGLGQDSQAESIDQLGTAAGRRPLPQLERQLHASPLLPAVGLFLPGCLPALTDPSLLALKSLSPSLRAASPSGVPPACLPDL